MCLPGAIKRFEWALEINPKCATCMKDLSEAHSALADGAAGGAKDTHLAEAEACAGRAMRSPSLDARRGI